MAPTLPLLDGSITLEEALQKETNILQELTYRKKRMQFAVSLWRRRRDLESLVALHLGISPQRCNIGDDTKETTRHWTHGSFNYCIPVDVCDAGGHLETKVLLRFPLPYKIGEAFHPGNAEEKLRCEAATYLWLQAHCPDVPIANLRGFGFPSGQSFSCPQDCSFLSRIHWSFRRTLKWVMGQSVPCHYIPRRIPHLTDAPYLILDVVKDGRMLSDSWGEMSHERSRRMTVFAGIARIMLSISAQTFSHIGSLTIDDQGVISLTNRPLTFSIHQLENDGVSSGIARDRTYTETDSYYSDLLNTHDNRLRDMANSINNTRDGELQLSVLTIMRALSGRYTNSGLRRGPFALMLTDLHQSNIFVDENWHITALIDLEWACVQPLEMLQPPYWLTDRTIDDLKGENLEDYNERRLEFMAAFEREEETFKGLGLSRTQTMNKGWKIGNFWYFRALDAVVGICNLYKHHIQPDFASKLDVNADFDRLISAYWAPKSPDFIATKIEERKRYQDRIREFFAEELGKQR